MAEKNSLNKQALEDLSLKLSTKLECSICFSAYTDPKLLPCFHVFCKECLEPLVVQDRNGLSLQCPTCRHAIQLPPKGVSGLQSDFHVDHLFEIRDALEKVNVTGSQPTNCEKCDEEEATGYCRDCGECICDDCTALHRKWKQFKAHEIFPLEEIHTEPTASLKLTKQVSYCPKHIDKRLKLYCETCSELICYDCTVKLHLGHEFNLVTDTFHKHKDEITASLEPVKQQLSTVSKAIRVFEERVKEIENQRVAIEAVVHKEINLLQQTLEQRRTELISELDHLTQLKLKNLAAQRDQVELAQVKVSSCMDYVEERLATNNEGEILAMKAAVLERIQQITADFNPATMQPEEEASLELVANNKGDLQQACRHFGTIDNDEISPENSYAIGEDCATVGVRASAAVITMDTNNAPYILQANLTADLVHSKSKATLPCSIYKEVGQYRVTYQPTHRGKHELHIKINGKELRDSPYTIAVTSSPQSLGRPVRVIGYLSKPYFATTNSQNQILLAESGSHRVSVYTPDGKKICSIGTKGTQEGQFKGLRGIAVDTDDNVYTVERENSRVQKFRSDGTFVKSVGGWGTSELQFRFPVGVCFHPNNHRLYVCDSSNHRIQILNADLTYHSTIGHEGNENGEFRYPVDVCVDDNGNIYVSDQNNCRVQIFNERGEFLRMFANMRPGQTPQHPHGIIVDSNNTVYVSEQSGHCINVFSPELKYLATFGGRGNAEGHFVNPWGLHVDKNDSLLVCGVENGRIQFF